MHRVPQGSDRHFDQGNVRRWMTEHGRGAIDYIDLAAAAARAFDVADMLADLDPGDHWIWDVAAEVADGDGIGEAA